jgi:site-specific DNA recombinase
MYADGKSPLSIAAQLNEEGIPAPRSGKSSDKKGGWRQTTINGNRQRGTGIINNELYIGKRIWNRLEYRKNPHTGKKVSRLNPESDWQIVEVPELRIVPMDLWNAVKARQDAQTKVRADKEPTDRNRLGANQLLRRRKHLLSGLLKCGKCGANLTIAGSVEKRYYCSTAKELGKSQCSGFPGLSSDRASEHVLSVLQTQMLTDEAFQRFQRKYIAGLEQARQDLNSADKVREKKVKRLEKEKQNLLKAVKSGRANDILFDELEKVAGELERTKAEYEANRPAPIELPKDLHKMYTSIMGKLVDTLGHEGVVGKAAETIHEMIDHIHVTVSVSCPPPSQFLAELRVRV